MISQNTFVLPEFDRLPIGFDFNGTYKVEKNTRRGLKRYSAISDIRATTEKSTALSGYYGTNSKVAAVFTNAIQSLGSSIDNVALKKNVESFLSAFSKELDYLDAQPNILPPIKIEEEEDNVFFEWVFSSSFRIGFTIVEKWEDSSWFLFLEQENVVGSVSGDFKHINQHIILRKLLSVVLENT